MMDNTVKTQISTQIHVIILNQARQQHNLSNSNQLQHLHKIIITTIIKQHQPQFMKHHKHRDQSSRVNSHHQPITIINHSPNNNNNKITIKLHNKAIKHRNQIIIKHLNKTTINQKLTTIQPHMTFSKDIQHQILTLILDLIQSAMSVKDL